jgi:hypothetical protein
VAFARVIVFDKRRQGLSDRVAEQTIEERIGDVRVKGACKSGSSKASPLAITGIASQGDTRSWSAPDIGPGVCGVPPSNR